MTAAQGPEVSSRGGLLDTATALAIERALRGEIVIVDHAQKEKRVFGDPGHDRVTVTVHDPATYAEVRRHGSVGLGRSYAAGWWDADDLVELCRSATRHLPSPETFLGRATGVLSRIRGDRSRSSSGDCDREAADVRAHYDLGEEFFKLFLDPSLTYSSALFERPWMSLEDAQLAKLERICHELVLGPGDEVLEIGSGWGSFAIHAASRYGCRVTTTTVSQRQFDYVKRRIDEEDLGDLVEVRSDDYRDITGSYDKLVSIEMIEAVGWRRVDRFFEVCSERLRPHGLMALQAIVIDNALYERAKLSDDFIKAMIFPGSSIPSLGSIERSVGEKTDMRVIGLKQIGHHYERTLAEWRENLLSRSDAVLAVGFEESFVRLWDLYLAYCQAGFAERRIGDLQLILAKPQWPGNPRR
jgi:cyclopropane-fatty-acyl-phospholipid synthase